MHPRPLVAAVAALLLFAAVASAVITVTPADPGDDGKPTRVDVETAWYRIRFDLRQIGAADSIIYKPLNHELRAENYYSTPNTFLRGVVRMADPDPITGITRRVGRPEMRYQSRQPATHRVVKHTEDELVIEFEWRNLPNTGPEYMAKLLNRRRVILREDTPAIRVERDVVNQDAEDRSVVLDLYNSASLGKVRTVVAIPAAEGKETGIDRAMEAGSSFLLVPRVAGSWIGGVNQKGLGAAYHYEWPDVDAMQVCMWKTVGASYHIVTRRRKVPAGKAITFRYTFLPFTGFAALDGMAGDLVGGVIVGAKAGFEKEVWADELKPGATVPVKITLAAGSDRKLKVRITCVRKEDGHVAFDETADVALKTVETTTLTKNVTFPRDGLYVLRVTASAANAPALVMERGLEVGRSKLTYKPTPPAVAKRGKRDAGKNMSPPRWHKQFRTLDQTFVTRHEPFLKNHANGPVKAFFLTRADSTLAHVREIMQRGDFDYEVAVCEKVQNPKGSLHPQAFRQFEKRFKAAEPDVFIALAIDSEKGLKQRFLRTLFGRVADGLGLVITGPALKKQPLLAKMLADCTPVTDAPLAPCAVARLPVKRYTHGKGRIVVIEQTMSYYRDDGFLLIRGWDHLQVGNNRVAIAEFKWRGFEYAYAHLAQIIRWAARKDSGITLRLNEQGEATPGDGVEYRFRTMRWTPLTAEQAKRYAGPLVVEATKRNAKGETVAFASIGRTQPGPKLTVVLDRPHRKQSAPGACEVVATKASKGAEVLIEVLDRFGRLVFRERKPLKGGRVSFGLASIKPRSVYHEIVARLYAKDNLLAVAAGDLYLMPDEPPYRHRFMAGIAGAPERKALHIQGMIDACRRAGFELHTHCYNDTTLYWSGGFSGGYAFLPPKRKHRKNIFTPPAVPDDAWIEKTKTKWQARARGLYERGVTYIQIDDERRMSGEYDWHPRTLAAFREHLKTVYPDIAALNKTWGADFKTFADVMPKTRKELGKGADNMAPWLDFRMFIGHLFGTWYIQKPAEWAAEISPEISVGELGIYPPSADWPVDWSKFAKYYRDTGRYTGSGDLMADLFRSFSPGSNHGGWQGYGMTEITPRRRVQLWRSLLGGGHWAWFWAMRDNGYWNYALCTNDLIIRSDTQTDGIALAYSYPSWLIDRAAHGVPAKKILEELGCAFNYVNLEDVAKDALIRDQYTLLVVQQASCISKEQVAGMRRFVEQGGHMLVVGRPGRRDLHGAPHADGPALDTLVGVDTSASKSLGRQRDLSDNLRLTVDATGPVAKEAKVLVTMPDPATPILARRAVGGGSVWWLNSTLAGHAGFFTGGVAGEKTAEVAGPQAIRRSHHTLFERVLDDAGIAPRSKLRLDGKPIHGWHAWHYATPSGRTQIVVRYVLNDFGKPLTLTLPRKGHVYDLRAHKYFGETDRVAMPFPPGRVNVLAVLDYEVTGVAAKLSKAACKPGDVLSLSCVVATDGNAPDLHPIRISVVGPDGKALEAHRDVLLAPAGKATATIPLALNARKGKYVVRAKDAVSGKTGEATFTLKQEHGMPST